MQVPLPGSNQNRTQAPTMPGAPPPAPARVVSNMPFSASQQMPPGARGAAEKTTTIGPRNTEVVFGQRSTNDNARTLGMPERRRQQQVPNLNHRLQPPPPPTPGSVTAHQWRSSIPVSPLAQNIMPPGCSQRMFASTTPTQPYMLQPYMSQPQMMPGAMRHASYVPAPLPSGHFPDTPSVTQPLAPGQASNDSVGPMPVSRNLPPTSIISCDAEETIPVQKKRKTKSKHRNSCEKKRRCADSSKPKKADAKAKKQKELQVADYVEIIEKIASQLAQLKFQQTNKRNYLISKKLTDEAEQKLKDIKTLNRQLRREIKHKIDNYSAVLSQNGRQSDKSTSSPHVIDLMNLSRSVEGAANSSVEANLKPIKKKSFTSVKEAKRFDFSLRL